ncbi:MAG: DNA gyrase inhibitor YacG [Candidatus Binatia bacterium]
MPAPDSVRCPTCRQAVVWERSPYRPFCSERCRLRDLGNWASERYRIPDERQPGSEAPGDDENDE